MSIGDRISNKAEELGGKAKEAAGKVNGDNDLSNEGRADQANAGLKGAAGDVKDAVSNLADKAKGAMHRD
ncbi:MAG TPA: CsbD family protein [Pseudonocardiaceae bacterium]|jgi:uncharacterized protein YjbJ (UPF0337 family)